MGKKERTLTQGNTKRMIKRMNSEIRSEEKVLLPGSEFLYFIIILLIRART